MVAKKTKYSKGIKRPRKRVKYIAPKPDKPRIWVRCGPNNVLKLKVRGNVRTGKQSGLARRLKASSVCVAATIYGFFMIDSEWTISDIDEILLIGDEIYRSTLLSLKLKVNSSFPIECIIPTFYVNFYNVTILLSNNDSKQLIRNQSEISELHNIITPLMPSCNGIVLQCNRKYFALWFKDDGESYYLFSPDGYENYLSDPILIKSNDLNSLLEYGLQYTLGEYRLYPIKLLKKIKIHQKLNDYAKNTEYDQMMETEFALDDESHRNLLEKKQAAIAAHATAVSATYLAKKQSEKMAKADESVGTTVADRTSMQFNSDFMKISNERGILRGSAFVKEPDRILHTIIAAALYVHHIPTALWNAQSLSDVIKFGKKIFEDSEDLVEKDEWTERIQFPIQFGRKNLGITFDKVVFGIIKTLNNDIYSFEQGVRKFFEIHDMGLVLGPQTVLIWQERGVFFMFDAKERDSRGRKWTKALTKQEDAKAGYACITWFVSPIDLAELYVSNIVQKHRKDPYKIIKLNIHEVKSKSEDFNSWIAIAINKWIIVSSKNICNYTYLGDSQRYGKTLTTCVAALAYPLIKDQDEWITESIDEIFDLGNIWFKHSVIAAEEDKIDITNFTINAVKPQITYEGKRFKIEVEPNCISGKIRLTNPIKDKSSLLPGIRKLLAVYGNGILIVKNIIFAIWKNKKFSYVFYPYEINVGRLENCLPADPVVDLSNVFGFAYVLRFKRDEELATELINYLKLPETEDYSMHFIGLDMVDISDRLPLYNYSEFGAKGAILRPYNDIHEGSEMFAFRADKQLLCNLVTALCFARLFDPFKWTKSDFYDILRIGDRLYCKIVNGIDDCKMNDYFPTWDDIVPIIGLNRFTFTRNQIEGVFKEPDPEIEEEQLGEEEDEEEYEEEAPGMRTPPVTIPPKDLRTILSTWNKSGAKLDAVIESEFFSVAIWKRDNCFFVLDSKASDEKGALTERRIQIAKSLPKSFMPSQMFSAEDTKSLTGAPKIRLADFKKYKNDGSASVFYFSEFEDFYNHLYNKCPIEYIYQGFVLNELELKTNAITSADFEYPPRITYRAMNNIQSIIRGTISQNDHMFLNKGKQNFSNCIVALTFALLSSPGKWTKTLLDVILKYGDRLYTKSIDVMKTKSPEELCELTKLSVEHLSKVFTIYKIKFEFDIVRSVTGVMVENDLKKNLSKIGTIEGKVGTLLSVKGCQNAVFRSTDNYFYIFDPCDTDPSGNIAEKGVASITRFRRIDPLVSFLVDKYRNVNGWHYYELFTISIVLTPPRNITDDPEYKKALEKLKFTSQIPRSQQLFVEVGETMMELKNELPDDKIPHLMLCLSAIIHSRIHYVEFWNYNVFERIHFLAKYLLSKPSCDLEKIKNTDIDFSQINPNFTMDNNILCHIDTHKVFEGPISVKSQSQNMGLAFRTAMIIFFKECKFAIIKIAKNDFALWNESERSYLFGINGLIAWVLSSNNINDLVDKILSSVEYDTIEDNHYQIWRTRITTVAVNEAICTPPYITSSPPGHDLMGTQRVATSEYCTDCFYEGYVGKTLDVPRKRVKTYFVTLPTGHEILSSQKILERHKFYKTDDFFPCLKATCVIAAGLVHLKSPSLWSPKTLKSILNSGENLYINSLAIQNIDKEVMQITDLERVFFLSNIRVEICAMAPATEVAYKENLLTVLTYVLRKHKTAYLINDKFCFTIVMEMGAYYLYYPGSIESFCNEVPPDCSCLIKFCSLSDLIEKMLMNPNINCSENVLTGPIVVTIK